MAIQSLKSEKTSKSLVYGERVFSDAAKNVSFSAGIREV